jgi:hypothetical protein
VAENGSGPAAVTAPAAPSAPAVAPSQPAVSGEFEQVSRGDLERYRRYEQQVRGLSPVAERLAKFGIKGAEDLERYAPVFETINTRKIDPSGFRAMFSPEADRDLKGETAQPQFNPDELEQRVMTKVERQFAEREHKAAEARHARMLDELVKELVPDADDLSKEDARYILERHLETGRKTYPEGHPLSKEFLQPLSESDAKKASEWWKERQTKRAGQAMADKAKAAMAGAGAAKPSKAPAGNSAGQGTPNQPTGPLKPGTPAHRAHVEAILAQRQAARGQR